MRRKVRLSDRAKQNQFEIWYYIAQDNIGAADRLASRLTEVYLLLSENPEAGPSKPHLGDGIRTFTVSGHVICYRVTPDAIEVVAVFHGARNITRRLLEE